MQEDGVREKPILLGVSGDGIFAILHSQKVVGSGAGSRWEKCANRRKIIEKKRVEKAKMGNST